MKNSIKKILITHSSNDNYGASKVLISLVDTLIKNGYDIYLILPSNGPMNDNQIIKKTKLKILNLGVFRKKYFTIFGLINRVYFIIKSSVYIKNFLKKNKIDLVYINTSTIISPAIAAKFAGIPSIFHIHEIPNSNFIYARFITLFLNNFSRNIICVSKSVKEFWTKKGINKNKLEIINNGFIFNNMQPKIFNKEKIIFSSISRIIPYKGHMLMIDIFEKLFKKNSNIYLQIIGDSLPQYQKYFDKLKLNIKKKGIDSRVKFMGFRNDIDYILMNSNFFIHTPIMADPFPTVIFEAIQTKTPVITNDLGGAIEILNNGNYGLIIENNLIDDSVDKILRYIENHELQKENINKAFNYVYENFSLDKFEKKIIKIIG